MKYDKEKDDCEAELLDSDGDDLPDVFEETYGTDPKKKDTDEDGLTDYEEIYLTETDPLVYNSVDESLSDAEADSDGDGLSNRKELDRGMNPLNPDTDGDGIPDGDEIKLKLDPTSDTTDGIKDSERTTEQEIAADSEVMSQINTDENPMKVSIELEAAGLAETSLSVGESGYASAISNSAVIGAIPEFTYMDGLSTGEVTVKFTVDESVRNNTVGTYAEDCDELKGIKRLNVFKYFEDTNILLQIETFHDEENNTVYAKTDCLGTYCVMDLEVWMKNLGVEPVSDSEKAETVQVAYGAANEADDERLNVVFFLDARGSVQKTEFEKLKNLIYDTAKEVQSGYMQRVNLSVMVNHGGAEVYNIPLNDVDYFQRIPAITNNVAPSGNKAEIIDITSCYDMIYNAYSNKAKDTLFIMVVTDNMILTNSADSKNIYQKLAESEKIHISLVSDSRSTDIDSYVTDIIKETDGKIIKSDMASVKKYITSYLPNTYSIYTVCLRRVSYRGIGKPAHRRDRS